MTLAFFIYKNPDNDWIRWANRIPSNKEQSDYDLSKIRFRAIIGGILAFILVLMGLTVFF
ncbi:hypothetical protein JCM10914_1964 [Paenibacillus sp. JCM 10914]|nr:hypothetical protein JCM10914_1964 [Paenibacillus sp. JCM 10914]